VAAVQGERTTMKGEGKEECDAQHSLDVEKVLRWKLSVPRVGPNRGPLTGKCPSKVAPDMIRAMRKV